MLAKLIAFLSQFTPGPKSLALAITPAFIMFDHYVLHGKISEAKIITVAGVCAAYLSTHWFGTKNQISKEDLLKLVNSTVTKAILPVFFALGLFGLGGCASISPTTIQTDVTLGLSTALQGAMVGDPAIDTQLKTDAATIAKLINSAILPQFQGAKLGTVAANAGPQAIALLQAKILGLKNGSKLMAEIKLWGPVAIGALASVNAPGSYLSAQAQADLSAFFSGVSQGISVFVGDPSLMPPAPPAVIAPIPPVPAAAPAPSTPGGTK